MDYGAVFLHATAGLAAEDESVERSRTLPHFAYVNHSWVLGRSKAFPRTGTPLGPGGRGPRAASLRLRRKERRRRRERVVTVVMRTVCDVEVIGRMVLL